MSAPERPKWLPDISTVEETVVGLFALNEGDEELFGEAFALIRFEAIATERGSIRKVLLGFVDNAEWIEEPAEKVFEQLGLDPLTKEEIESKQWKGG